MKKFLNGLKCVLPLIVALGIQVLVGAAVSIVLSIQIGMQIPGASIEEINTAVMNQFVQMSPIIIFCIHIITTVIAAVWFYFVSGKKAPGNPIKGFSPLTIVVMLCCMVGLQYFSSGFLMILSNIAPGLMQGYSEIIQNSGIGALTPLSVLTTVVLAPIGEELIFRGITLKWLEKVTNKFFIANLIQAILFGVFHANIVQGIYAMVMGLVFGYVRKRYHSMYAAILLHALVNFCGTVISPLIFHNRDIQLGASIALCAGSFIILVVGILLINKDTKEVNGIKEQEGEPTTA